MRLIAGLFAIAVLVPLAVPASATSFRSTNNMLVRGTPAEFEVFSRAGRNTGREMFCAAGDFAWRRLSARTSDRLVVIRGLSPSPTDRRRESMGFRLVSADNSRRNGGWDLTLQARRGQGQSRSVGHARILCERR